MAAAHKGNVKSDFALPCEIFAQSCETFQQDENAVDGFSTSHHQRNCWGSCENVFFSRFLDEEAFGRPLRWC